VNGTPTNNSKLGCRTEHDAQAKRLGTALFAACADDAASQGQVIAVVKATLGSTGFYERQGFRIVAGGAEVKRGVEIPHILMRRDS
jgi:predicted N-acetyltransferase YhbS